MSANTELNEFSRRVWQEKAVLREIYEDAYRQISSFCVPGTTLELGGGSGNLKQFLPDIISSDVQVTPWLDLVADAHYLPFADQSLANIVMFDVLHHLDKPLAFFKEAERVLVKGGRVVVCEPALSPLGRLFYTYFHHEPLDAAADPLAPGAPAGDRSPYDANIAYPHNIFGRDATRLRQACPQLDVRIAGYNSLFAYPLSGGFRSWSLLPAALARSLLALERRLAPALGPLLAFRFIGVVEKS